jgi:hypothetical protein
LSWQVVTNKHLLTDNLDVNSVSCYLFNQENRTIPRGMQGPQQTNLCGALNILCWWKTTSMAATFMAPSCIFITLRIFLCLLKSLLRKSNLKHSLSHTTVPDTHCYGKHRYLQKHQLLTIHNFPIVHSATVKCKDFTNSHYHLIWIHTAVLHCGTTYVFNHSYFIVFTKCYLPIL